MANKLTIAIPTHNRSRLLRATLTSIDSLQLPSDYSTEILIIDNNSTDDTASVIGEFAATSHLPIRRIFEPRQGSSFARNRAVDEASGDYLLFIDDDAVAEPRWALELLDTLERRLLDAACGIVLPRWPVPPPRWLGPSVYIKLAVHNEARLRAAPKDEIEHIHNYFSANVGFRRDAFARFGKFREDLGVVGGNPISGEDTELFERFMHLGGAVGFASAARVHHLIPPERMTRSYLRRKSYAFGFGSALTGRPTHNQLDKLARNAIRMASAVLRREHERTVYHELECANFFGYWSGRLWLHRHRAARIHSSR